MARILVVDNESPIRAMLADVLRAEGYHVSVARSGFEAIELVPAIRPDLVMLDVNMPGFDGFATLEHIRAGDPGLRVVMMSGADQMERALQHGAVGFLDKPYRPRDVVHTVARALDEGPGTGARAA